MGARTARQVRPRYGRIATAATSTSVTTLAVLGGLGALPSAAEGPEERPVIETVAHDRGAPRETGEAPAEAGQPETLSTTPTASDADAGEPGLPADSGEGRRVVFSEGQQRVWLVGAGDRMRHTYLVSGSVYDNLDPGTYSVYSRSEQAWGIDDSGSMKYFVRFAHGDNAAIGFHDIPIDDGEPVQTVQELGTPLSHGCIRQRRADAKLMWAFAPVGTKVVVTA
jgi:lipoprotein-anchoring transpeptidase ErfK/SrfK